MKAYQRRGFTLVEMLMVVTVIGVLIMLLIAAIGGVTGGARKSRIETEILGIENALRSYMQLYGRFPRHTNLGSQGADPEGSDSGGLTVNQHMIRLLRGEDHPSGLNPRRVAFMEISDTATNEAGDFADAWGNPYRYMCDFNYDNRVRIGGFGGGTRTLDGRSVAVWSTGPTGPGTTNDFILSWE